MDKGRNYTALRTRLKGILSLLRSSKALTVGLILLIVLFGLGFVASYVVSKEGLVVGSLPLDSPPSPDHLLGTDSRGTDVFTILLHSIKNSLTIGLITGLFAVAIGLIVGFISGYKGGIVDTLLRSVTDVFLVIPLYPLLVILAAYLGTLSPISIALLLAGFAWANPARGFRSQIITLRERGYVRLAKLSGEGTFHIIFKEILPNMLAYVGVRMANAVSWAMAYEVALTIVGIVNVGLDTLGTTVRWALSYGALTKLMWWWLIPPVLCLVTIFLGLQLVNKGLDEVYNPRLRK